MDRLNLQASNQNEGMHSRHTTRLNLDSWNEDRDRIPHVKEDFRVKDFLRPSDSPPSRPQRVNREIDRANGLLGEIATKLHILQKLVPSKIVEDFKYQVSTIHQDFIKNSQEAIRGYGDFYSRRSHNHREQAFTELEKLNSDLKERYDDLFELEQRLSDIEEIQANKEHVLTTNRQHVDQTIESLIDKFKSAYTEIFDKYQPSITETNDGHNPIYKNKVERYLARRNVEQINNIIKEMHDDFIPAKKILSDIEEIKDKKDKFLSNHPGHMETASIINRGIPEFLHDMEASYDRLVHIYSSSILGLRSHSDNRDLILDRKKVRQDLTRRMEWLQQILSYMRNEIPDTEMSNQRAQGVHELQDPHQELAQSFNSILDQITGDSDFIENLPISNKNKLQSHITKFFHL
jgi:hypothetical protein